MAPPISPSIKANEPVPKNGTVSKGPPAAPRQTVPVFAFSSQSSWTPEAIAGIVFGILMFLLGVSALWQTRSRKLGFVGDIESQVRLLTVPYARFVRTDPDLWVPPYEPPQDFVCIADPPSSYANNDDPVLDKQEPKKPAPKPKPVLNPPQPRDEYGVEVDLTDMLPNVASYHGWAVGVQEPEKPAPKPKPGPKPKPPQPRDGYAAGFPPANFISGTDGKAFSTLADQVLISQ